MRLFLVVNSSWFIFSITEPYIIPTIKAKPSAEISIKTMIIDMIEEI